MVDYAQLLNEPYGQMMKELHRIFRQARYVGDEGQPIVAQAAEQGLAEVSLPPPGEVGERP